MQRFLRCILLLFVCLLMAYVGSFLVLVELGKDHAKKRGLTHAYFLADPECDPGYAEHYRRGLFFLPLVHVTQHWTHGPYPVYP